MFETTELDHDNIHDLVLRAQRAESPAERDRLEGEVILRCRPLAWGLARRYVDRGAELDDLRAVADAAVLGAMRRFDLERGGASSASPRSRSSARSASTSGTRAGPSSRLAVQDLQSRVAAVAAEIQNDGGAAGVAELAGRLDVSEAQVREALAARSCFTPTSLDAWPGDDRPTGFDVPVDENGYALAEDRVSLAGACVSLTDEERELIRLRFFEDLSQRQIADAQDRTQMQVSRELRRLLERLRATTEGEGPIRGARAG